MEVTNIAVTRNSEAATSSVVHKIKKGLKYLLFGASFFISAVSLLNLAWITSGSNRWELEIDRNGTQVYYLKSPGSSVNKFKGVTHYKYTYSHMLSAFIDPHLVDNCAEMVAGCVEYKFLRPWDSRFMANTQYWRAKLFPPFADREIILNGKIYQDKQTKEILLENSAAPNVIPPNDCCVRLSHMHNTWHYTPLGNGEVEVVYIQDFDMGGFFPGFLLSFGAEQVYKLLHTDIPALLEKKEEYRNAKLDFIEEY